ncbi:hypothetical protein EMPG_09815, partial [Blastomyces silverae]
FLEQRWEGVSNEKEMMRNSFQSLGHHHEQKCDRDKEALVTPASGRVMQAIYSIHTRKYFNGNIRHLTIDFFSQ